MNDAQESEPAAGGAPAAADAPKKPRGVPIHWSRPYMLSWGIHGVLLFIVGWLWLNSRPQKLPVEKRLASIVIDHAPEEIAPVEPVEEEVLPDIEEPEIHDIPELVEVPEEEPEFTPEDTPPVEPLDWEPPRDMFADVKPFKKKPEPPPQPKPKEPEPKPEPKLDPVPQAPTILQGAALPQIVEQETPAYPRKAVRLRWQGTVILRIQVDAEGKVIDVTVHESSGHEVLDKSAVAAFQNWVFEPRGPDDPAVRLLQKPFTFRLQ